ncbi:MAG: ABC transporter ATP-binding protein [Deltaproteobacteria bacterium]|nr:ABC transporter ATP-binding protein [Deltaproteobacteria bacterium]
MTAVQFQRATKEITSGFLGRHKRILDDVSFSVVAGQIHGIVGHNGAGKSTSLRLLTGCSRPTSGVITLFGESPTQASTRRRLGFAPDIAALPLDLRAEELVAFVAAARRLERVDPRAAVERVGLEFRSEPLRSYSKGMQQRLSLALAILGDPDVWVLDEPMSGLDPQGRQLVRQLLIEHRLRGGTVIFSSHSLADVDALCEHLTVLEKGRVAYSGPARELIGVAEFEVEFVGVVPIEGLERGVHGSVAVVGADGLRAFLTRVPDARVHSILPRVPDLATRMATRR